MEIFGPIIAAILTIMVFSYILGDNVLFKLAAHIFVGVAIGYATLVIWYEVFVPLFSLNNTAETIPFVQLLPAFGLCLFLTFKMLPKSNQVIDSLGSLALAFILGVGASLAIGGALFGTLIPQIDTLTNISLNVNHYPNSETEVGLVRWLNNIIIILGTIGTFFYFTFAVRASGPLGGLREGLTRFWAGMGRLMIIFTLGALFANTVSSRVALLISRLQFLANLFG